ncbi:heavy metal translocating P-type ATPase [Ornithinibacter sp.]|jgi:Cu+-exporting ATPase|uniref:heavy metal translocating P-type ATPase n=1 Tax=Ornithinibacter sp. TaxID=2862748 RepID=UPI002CCC476D|nr:heavy metal translocating P-type ATPase [Ornithinibacter sp.]HQZ08711.1 heavy metal translocating P-type ATPase [Ornithinibacter sp.]HRA25083.1 heavy metal translocating P-type ATPase [Ornithinibacter sp.]
MTQTTDRPQHDHDEVREVDLAITGMTCASCSARIEKKLGKLDGVDAVVNLATEKATVRYAGAVTVEDLLRTVRATGYGAEVVRGGPQPEAAGSARTPSDLLVGTGTPGGGSARTPSDLLVDSGTHENHLDHAVAPEDALKRRTFVAAVLTVPVVILAMVPGIHLDSSPWVQLVLATPVVLWAGWPFHRAAALNARHGASTMDTLVSIGVLTAYLWSAVVVLTGRASTMADMGTTNGVDAAGTTHLWFETATVVTTFLLIGRWMEARATDRTRDALRGLMSLGAKDVAVERVDPTTRATTEVRIPVDQLGVGDRFVVRPGEKVATDGRVVEGSSAVDASLVTGESLPVDVAIGDDLVGGSINTTGRLVVEATRVGADTTLAGIARLVERAQTTKAPIQRLADRVSAIFVPIVLVLAVLTFLGWWIGTGDPARALEIAIAVLVIACPCALGLATPTALLVGTGRGARLGILIKGADVLEDTRRIDTVVLDKTGTVTSGEMTLVDVATAGRLPKDQALRAAAAVEAGSEHPVARAVVTAAASRAIDVPRATDFVSLPGAGARAIIKGTEVTVGRADLFDDVPQELARPTVDGTTVWVGWGGRAHASLTVADTVRRSSQRAVRDLTELGLPAYLLTGDHDQAALTVARDVGIPVGRVIADVRPEDKHAMIADLQKRGKVVAMVGDGVNDAAALAQADLGIAMGTGTDVAADSADIVLLRSELPAVVDAIELSRATLRTIKQNLGWAFGYNIAAIPLAMAGLLNPMIAGGAMAASSVLVVSNSLRLRRWSREG